MTINLSPEDVRLVSYALTRQAEASERHAAAAAADACYMTSRLGVARAAHYRAIIAKLHDGTTYGCSEETQRIPVLSGGYDGNKAAP